MYVCVCVLQIEVHQLFIVTAIVNKNNVYMHTCRDLLFGAYSVLCVYIVVVILGSQCEVDS